MTLFCTCYRGKTLSYRQRTQETLKQNPAISYRPQTQSYWLDCWLHSLCRTVWLCLPAIIPAKRCRWWLSMEKYKRSKRGRPRNHQKWGFVWPMQARRVGFVKFTIFGRAGGSFISWVTAASRWIDVGCTLQGIWQERMPCGKLWRVAR